MHNLSDKTQADYLAQVLARRAAAKNRTQLFDHSVPETMLFHGLIRSNKTGTLAIRTEAPTRFSPFVVHLTKQLPSPIEVMQAEEELRAVHVNLLLPESHFLSLEELAPEVSDLALEATDIAGQIRESIGAESLLPRWSAPRLRFSELQPVRASRDDAVAVPLPIDQFAPSAAPENLLDIFDLPEFEEELEEEASPLQEELVLLEELEKVSRKKEVPRREPLSLGLPVGWPRALGAFVLVSFAFVLPLHAMNLVSDLRDAKDGITASGEAGLSTFASGAGSVLSRDTLGAANAFSEARSHFSNAGAELQNLGASTNILLSSLPGAGKEYKAAAKLIEAGELLAFASGRLADGFSAITKEIDPTPTSRLALLETYTESALPHIQKANGLIAGIDPEIFPENERAHLETLQQKLPLLAGSLAEFLEFSEMFQLLLGADGTKRYLVVFQNNTEIRPTGGFMGSFAEIDVNDGEIVRMNIPGGGTYDLQGLLRKRVKAPSALQLLKARWEFQDANWFADFPTSARQILDFYADAGQGSVDGVIAVNATYVADLISLLGPVEMENYDRTITGENFVFEAQKIVELEYDTEENTPKAFIGDLAPILLDRTLEKTGDDFLTVLDAVNRGLHEKHIQLYFENDALEKKARELGWAGEVKWTDGDYLMIVDTNLGGGKTDGVIEQKADLEVHIAEDGTITNTLTIRREHFGISNELFKGVNNVDYLRIFVPKGSELLVADGFAIPDNALFEEPEDAWESDDDVFFSEESKEIHLASQTEIFEESGKTVFANWVQTKPGTESVVTFTYRLPFKLAIAEHNEGIWQSVKSFLGFPETETYSLTIQKQSGIMVRDMRVSIDVPESLKTLWSSHELDEMQFTNATDGFFAALFEQQ